MENPHESQTTDPTDDIPARLTVGETLRGWFTGRPKKKKKRETSPALERSKGSPFAIVLIVTLALLGLVIASLTLILITREDRRSPATPADRVSVTGDCSPLDGAQIVVSTYRPTQLILWGGDTVRFTTLATPPETDDTLAAPVWSPDGEKIHYLVYSRSGGTLHHDLYVLEAASHQSRRLTQMPAGYAEIRWSPNSRFVAFPGAEDQSTWVLHVIDVASGQDYQVASHHYTNTPWWDWSPDGSRLVFEERQNDITGVYVATAEGNNRILISADSGADPRPRWSSNGQMIVFSNINQRTIELADAATGEPLSRLDGQWNILGNSPIGPWSPDGKWIAYRSLSGRTGIAVIDLDSAAIHPITSGTGTDYFFGWSPDSRRVLYATRTESEAGLYSTPLDDGEPIKLYDGRVDYAAWSPDGQHIFFGGWADLSSDDQRMEMYLVDAGGNGLLKLGSDGLWNHETGWSPTSRYLTFRGDRQGLFLLDVTDRSICTLAENGADFDWK